MSLFDELKRRHVYRVAAAYAVVGWLLIEVATQIFPVFHIPDWAAQLVVLLIAIGFPIAVVLAWAFEMTPEGVRRTEPVDSPVARAPEHAHRVGKHLNAIIIGVLALAVVVLLWQKFMPSNIAPSNAPAESAPATAIAKPATVDKPATAPVANTIPNKSIAVLPFENLSEDTANGYFADGIQDQILTSLAKIGDLKVISRTSTQRYASRPDNVTQIAKELGVAHILEGSVQKAGNRVRINVQLIKAGSDSHLWAETYDRDLKDIFAVESEVAEMVAKSLAANLTGGERAALASKPTDNPDAYAAYLKARVLNSSSEVSQKAFGDTVAQYRKAVTLDPGFAVAWAELARVQIQMYWFGFDPTGELLSDAKANIDRAAALGPGLPQVELARGVYLYYARLDFAGALSVLREVSKQLPGDSEVLYFSALLERRLGQWDAAIADLQHAQSLNPNADYIVNDLALTLLLAHRYERGLQVIDTGLSLFADDSSMLSQKQWAQWNLGGVDAAESVLAGVKSDNAAIQALRGQQALYRRDYAAAARFYRRAIDTDDGIQLTSLVGGGYLPSSVEWQLRLALSQKRAGDTAQSAVSYRRARDQATRALAAKPANRYVEVGWHVVLGHAMSGLGQRDQAVAQGRQAVAMIPESKDLLDGPAWQDQLAMIHAINGNAASAVPLLRHLISTKGSFSTPAMLRIDPIYDPIRNDPGFQALLKQSTGNDAP